jgi:hypothetical protein
VIGCNNNVTVESVQICGGWGIYNTIGTFSLPHYPLVIKMLSTNYKQEMNIVVNRLLTSCNHTITPYMLASVTKQYYKTFKTLHMLFDNMFNVISFANRSVLMVEITL